MRNFIRHISHCVETSFPRGLWQEFKDWFWDQPSYQFDIETNITEWWNTRKLISMQFGSTTHKREQWFIQWSYLTLEQQLEMIEMLNKDPRQKLCHNGRYEYIVCRFYDIILENIYDTMVAEKVIEGGAENKDYKLADMSWKYLRMIMNKEQQTEFGDDLITHEKIEYGCTDVMHLDIIKRQQIEEAESLGLLNVMGLEMDVLPAISDITYEGMILDVDKWRANIDEALPIVEEATNTINGWLKVSPFEHFATCAGYMSDEDRIVVKFGSPKQRTEMLQLIFPDIVGGSMPIVKAYIRDKNVALSVREMTILMDYMAKDYTSLSTECVLHHRQYLIEHDYLIPGGTSTINWNSPAQVLPLAKLVEPKLKGLSEEEINKTTHPMLRDLQAYRKALKLINQYGEEFIHKYVGPDGKVRTNFNQILTTGRLSSSAPNLQNIVVGDKIANERDPNGTRYRNAFICEPGWKFVDSDYVSQELTIIAYISKDPVWMDCIENGYDLHSVCADLVYKDKWKRAEGNDCAYYRMVVGPDGQLRQAKQKCKCKGHKKLRDEIKPINFGLAYGMTEYKLAGELQISIPDARRLIIEFFNTFPKIGALLEFLGNYGVENGYIPTLYPFKRRRKFPYWNEYRHLIDAYKLGVYHVPQLGEIERASKNHPIQGTSADIVKVAMVLIRNYIKDNNLRDRVKFQAQVHDQITMKCIEWYAGEWKVIMDGLMFEAGKLVIPTGILKAETQITEVWTK